MIKKTEFAWEQAVRRTVYLYAFLFFSFLAAAESMAQQDQPPLSPGQRVRMNVHFQTDIVLDIRAEVLRVDEHSVRLLVDGVDRRDYAQALKGRTLDLLRTNIISYDVVTRGERTAEFIGTAAILLVLIALVITILWFAKRRQEKWRRALPATMAVLGGFMGLFIGAFIGQIMAMDKYELTTLGGKRGIPAEMVMTVVGAWLFGYLGFLLGKKRQSRPRRPDEASKPHG